MAATALRKVEGTVQNEADSAEAHFLVGNAYANDEQFAQSELRDDIALSWPGRLSLS